MTSEHKEEPVWVTQRQIDDHVNSFGQPGYDPGSATVNGKTEMRNAIGVDQNTLGETFRSVLCSSLRKAPECLVIVTPEPDDFVFEMVKTAFLTGTNVVLVRSKENAPEVTKWLEVAIP